MSKLNDVKIMDIAKELNLDLGQFTKDMNSAVVQNLINRDLKEGEQAGVNGTPTIFVNGKLLKERSIQGFERMIEAELKKRKVQ